MDVLINGKNAYNCSKDELNEAFDLLRDAYKFLNIRQSLKFRPGMRVSFVSRKRGVTITGTIKKVNSVTILVTPDDNPYTTWKVSPSLLTIRPSVSRTK
jgi:hypothetical protein